MLMVVGVAGILVFASTSRRIFSRKWRPGCGNGGKRIGCPGFVVISIGTGKLGPRSVPWILAPSGNGRASPTVALSCVATPRGTVRAAGETVSSIAATRYCTCASCCARTLPATHTHDRPAPIVTATHFGSLRTITHILASFTARTAPQVLFQPPATAISKSHTW
jgi:hypothetical protein